MQNLWWIIVADTLRMCPGNGSSRQVGVKNESQEEFLRQAMLLRGTIGRKASLIVKHRHVQKTPSIQAPQQMLSDTQ